MKLFFLKLIILLLVSCLSTSLFSQKKLELLENTFVESLNLYNKGDFENTEKNLKILIENQEYIPNEHMIAVYNLYGMLYNKLGRYNKAIEHYNLSIDLFMSSEVKEYEKLLGLYNNIALVYKDLELYEKSNLYFDNALNILNDIPDSANVKERRSRILYNKGILEYDRNNFIKAVKLFLQSLEIQKKYNLPGIDQRYFNLARCYKEMNKDSLAEKNFSLSIENRKRISGDFNFKLAPLYLNYGVFLYENNDSVKALKYLRSSVNLYVKAYGRRHPHTANSLRNLGEYYLSYEEYDSALYYFQKSLIANSLTFNSTNYEENPVNDDIISWATYLSTLKMKSVCFQKMYFHKEKEIKYIFLSNKLNSSAIDNISKLSSTYISNESKFDVTEDGKKFYTIAVENFIELYSITDNETYLEKAYHFAYRSKAGVLEEQILKEAHIRQELPVEVLAVKNKAEEKIAAYKRLIFEENSNLKPNKEKLSIWQSNLLDLNIKYESFLNILKKEYPAYEENMRLVKNLSVDDLQKRISGNSIIVEYFIGNNTLRSDTNMFIFVISKKDIFFRNVKIGKEFFQNIEYVNNEMNNFHDEIHDLENFNEINKSLNELYLVLITPVREFLDNKDLIIIPDEEISLISFETLLSEYKDQKVINYSALPYLIKDFAVSYAYSASLLYKKEKKNYNDFIFGFAPEYRVDRSSSSNFYNLKGAVKEIESILQWIEGSSIIGVDANRSLFDSISKERSIIHFAMHASVDKDQPDFSYLAFSNLGDDSTGVVYNYEIEMMDIQSPMVVLSACNTGSGEIYNGEGIMSLTRSFLHAGVPSVVHSIWNVNDQTGMKIMEDFFKYLSKGNSKSDALRAAKLDYLNNAGPTAANPYYWAGYIITGDRSPVIKKDTYFITIALILLFMVSIFYTIRKLKKNKS